MPLTLFGYNIGTGTFSSSRSSRNALRGNLVSQAIGTTFDPYTGIPAKLAQMITSSYAFFCNESHHSERIIHGLLVLNATAEFAVFTSQLFMGEDCSGDASICTASIFMQLTYTGILAAAESFSEYSKDAYEAPEVSV